MEKDLIVNVRIFFGGVFQFHNDNIEYVGGGMQLMSGILARKLTYRLIFNAAYNMIGKNEVPFVWYRKFGTNLTSGKTIIRSWQEISEVLKSRDKNNDIDLYVTTKDVPFEQDHTNRPVKIALKKKPIIDVLLRSNPRKLPGKHDIYVTKQIPLTIDSTHCTIPTTNLPQIPSKLLCRRADKGKAKVVNEVNEKGDECEHKNWEATHCLSEKEGENVEVFVKQKGERGGAELKQNKVVLNYKRKDSGSGLVEEEENGFKQKTTNKAKGKQVLKGEIKQKGEEKEKVKKVVVKAKGNRSKRGPKKSDKELDWEEEFEVIDDDDELPKDELGDTVKFGIGEEELEQEELFQEEEEDDFMHKVASGLTFEKACEQLDSGDDDSDELRSLQGSDDEADNRPIFNPKTDFKNKVKLRARLKFADPDVMRKAFVHHAIENRYDFYYLHSASDRVTCFCRYRCSCDKWDKVRCKFVGCKCPKKTWCPYRIYATKKETEEYWEISTMNLKHTCEFTGYTKKVTSEYLAERYLEDWREDPTWNLSKFQRRVYRDLGIEVKYGVCWLARARAKLLIYGDGEEQYARVWDYVAAVIKYNPGSTAIVMVGNIERPPPIFQRMYLCIKAVKNGFLAGCRPLVGVDGCHLKGAYPGMCLVAVGKDGNNNIYPIAWAVVEVENGETWSWFLKLLIEDLVKLEGDGLTFMSDRQKGLLDAFKVVTPKAELRFCVRHIWANFKLQFTGQVFKDTFWSAARCTTKAEFEAHMKGMKYLSVAAYEYLAAIPPQHWSRHAFSPISKSNMLLNNMCESFNAILKDARDKPILTHMEWMRRHVMKRHCQKREGLKKWEGTIMPYVDKYLKWAVDEARLGLVFESHSDKYEVEYRGEQHVVQLKERSCSCNHWQLTGLPCPHAVACIIKNRGIPKTYVHEAYSRATYEKAYAQSISPMPGVKQWESSGLDDPLPPPYRKMPGRPNQKKRKKEAGEGTSKDVKRPRRQRACGNCGVLGHNTKTCKNPPKTMDNNQTTPLNEQVPRVAREKSKSTWSQKIRDNNARRKAQKEFASSMLQGQSSVVQESQSSVNVLDS